MSCNLFSFDNCADKFGIGGGQSIFVTPFSSVQSVVFQNNLIFNIVGNPIVVWHKLDFDANSMRLNENGERAQKGIDYSTSVSGKVANWSVEKTEIFHRLFQKKIVLLFKDNRSQYFLIGWQNGCLQPKRNYTTGEKTGNYNGYSVEFTTIQKRPMAKLSENAINNLNFGADCNALIGDIFAGTLVAPYYPCLVADWYPFIYV